MLVLACRNLAKRLPFNEVLYWSSTDAMQRINMVNTDLVTVTALDSHWQLHKKSYWLCLFTALVILCCYCQLRNFFANASVEASVPFSGFQLQRRLRVPPRQLLNARWELWVLRVTGTSGQIPATTGSTPYPHFWDEGTPVEMSDVVFIPQGSGLHEEQLQRGTTPPMRA